MLVVKQTEWEMGIFMSKGIPSKSARFALTLLNRAKRNHQRQAKIIRIHIQTILLQLQIANKKIVS
jgi:hypothetical protein